MAELKMMPTVKNEFTAAKSACGNSDSDDERPKEEYKDTSESTMNNTYSYAVVRLEDMNIGFSTNQDFMSDPVVLRYKPDCLTFFSPFDSSDKIYLRNIKCVGTFLNSIYVVDENWKYIRMSFCVPVQRHQLYWAVATFIKMSQYTFSSPFYERWNFYCLNRFVLNDRLDSQFVAGHDKFIINKALFEYAKYKAACSFQ